jgi:predicted AlkP superfamily phosphohydrolase/phosphomutase
MAAVDAMRASANDGGASDNGRDGGMDMLTILQFGAASISLLERMLAEGRLPTLAGLRERGVWHNLETPATHFAGGAFHTLYSGTEITDHGLVFPFQWSASDQRVRYTTAFDAPPPVWEQLAERGMGLHTLALDPYESRPPRTAPAGTVVSGWQFTNRVVLQPWSSPPEARDRLKRLFGPPAAVEDVFGRSSTRDLLRWRRDLLAASGRAADAATLLLAGDRFDLTWVTFSAPHIAGHQLWDLSQIDEDLDDATRRVLASALEEVYQTVDAAFDRVLAALPDDADVIVVSPVGMEVNTSRTDLLPAMLDAVLLGRARPDSGAGWVWKLRAAVPTGLRARVAAALPTRVALELTARLESRGQDWNSTRAFAQPADNQGYVRLNLCGRERDGIVAPAEAESLMDEIATGLLTFRDPDGTASVKSVERVTDTFGTGAHADRLPDLIVRWSERPATRLGYVQSERFGTVRRQGSGSGRSGNHTADAWALVVPGASRARTPTRPPRLVDVAATAAALAGGGIADLPGEPLLER